MAIYRRKPVAVKVKILIPLCCISLIVFSCSSARVAHQSDRQVIPYRVTGIFPHDTKAFTQGLVMHQGNVYESTGLKKRSWIAKVDLETGEQHKKVELEKQYFGEGITILHDKLYQLTWKHHKGFIYDLHTFQQIGTFSYPFRGWGMTTDHQHLIISDGTDKIYYLDTLHFNTVKTLSIREDNKKVRRLNELEFMEGYIFANQWKKNVILIIDPASESVVGKIDMSPVVRAIKRSYKKANTLNGIAYDKDTKNILITGKYWPKAYMIQLLKNIQ